MANRYWVGGSGTWNASSTTNWSTSSGGASGASAPNTGDAAIFDANSNTGTNDFTVTLSGSPACLTLNTTGIDPATAMTVAGTGNLTVAGTVFTLTNKVVWSATGNLTFSVGASTLNITTAGVSIDSPVILGGSSNSSTYNFVDAFTSTKLMQLNRGVITTTGSNKNITVLRFTVNTGTGTRTVNAGTGTFALTGNNATVLTVGDATFTSPSALSLTYSGSTGTRTIDASASGNTKTIGINVTDGSDTIVFTTGASITAIKSLDFTGFSGTLTNSQIEINGNLVVSTGMTLGSGTSIVSFNTNSLSITSNGKTFDFPVEFGGTGTITITLNDSLTIASSRTLTINNQSITLALGASNLTTGALVTVGTPSSRSVTNTSGKIILTGNARTILDTKALTFTGIVVESNYSGSTGTRTISCDTGNPQLKITAGSDIVTISASSNFDGIDFTGFSGNFTISGGNTTLINNLVLSSTMTTGTGSGNNIYFSTNSMSITSNGVTIGYPIAVLSSANLTLNDNLKTTQSLTLTAGTLNANDKNVEILNFISSNSNTRTLALGSGTWTITGDSAGSVTNVWNTVTITNLTITGTAIISMTSASAKQFGGGGASWPTLNQGGAGTLTITGANTFTTLSNTYSPATIIFPASTTTTVTNFNINGTGGNLVVLNSSTAGTRATLSKASGSVSAQYLNIKDINATGGASWTALNSTNSGNNLGWVFAVPGFFFFFGV